MRGVANALFWLEESCAALITVLQNKGHDPACDKNGFKKIDKRLEDV